MLSMSRWFVGSSRSRQFAPDEHQQAELETAFARRRDSVPTGCRIWS